MSTEAQHQIAREEARKAFVDNENYVCKHDSWRMPPDLPVTEELLTGIILSAIERATEEQQAANDNLFMVARKHCVENKKLKDEWPEGYDLTSFLHGDDPAAQLQRSEQQEWTPEYVAGLMARSPLKNRESELLRGYGAVSDAHNAALTAALSTCRKIRTALAKTKEGK